MIGYTYICIYGCISNYFLNLLPAMLTSWTFSFSVSPTSNAPDFETEVAAELFSNSVSGKVCQFTYIIPF